MAKRLYERGFNVFATCLDPRQGGGAELRSLGSSSQSSGGENGDRASSGGVTLKVLALDVTDDVSVAHCLEIVRRECSNSGKLGEGMKRKKFGRSLVRANK